jgi:hypothetical protein
MDESARRSAFARIIMEQLKVGTNDLPSVAKKNVAVAATSVSSTEAFPTVGLALQLEVPTAAATSIRSQKVGEECWNFGLDGRLEVVVASIYLKAVVASIHLAATAMSKAAQLWETLPTASRVVGCMRTLQHESLTC